MLYQAAAELVLALHLGFILFVIFGGIAARWRPRVAWLHLPLLVWGAAVNLAGWTCPLTPLENQLRRLAGETGYPGSFLEEYIAPVVYPRAMTREVALAAGIALPAWNLGVYAWVRWRRSRDTARPEG